MPRMISTVGPNGTILYCVCKYVHMLILVSFHINHFGFYFTDNLEE